MFLIVCMRIEEIRPGQNCQRMLESFNLRQTEGVVLVPVLRYDEERAEETISGSGQSDPRFLTHREDTDK